MRPRDTKTATQLKTVRKTPEFPQRRTVSGNFRNVGKIEKPKTKDTSQLNAMKVPSVVDAEHVCKTSEDSVALRNVGRCDTVNLDVAINGRGRI